MKRGLLYTVVAVLVLVALRASASVINTNKYTDVPGMPTQGSVLDVENTIQQADQDQAPYDLLIENPSDLTVHTLDQIYTFVTKESSRPVRYFPDDVQGQIASLMAGGDPDSLHMTEFMSILPGASTDAAGNVTVDILMDVDYQPGQLIIVLIGRIDSDSQIRWTPIKGEVVEKGRVRFAISQELLSSIQGMSCLLSVLTDRVGERGNVIGYKEVVERVEFPSKTAQDITRIGKIHDSDGNPFPDDFSILVTDENEAITQEFNRIYAYVRQEGNTLADYFDSSVQEEARLMLPKDLSLESLLAYEAVPVTAVNYKATYGDAVANFQFATLYQAGQHAVTLVGVANSEDPASPMKWTVLRTDIAENTIDITFKQQVLPVMEEQKALLLVLSDPMGDNAE